MVFRFLLILSLVPIAIALASRWWYGVRVLAEEEQRPCRCDLKCWLPPPGDNSPVHRADGTAGEFGRQLRLKALAEWNGQNPKAARSRENSLRFGLAVPPLSAIIAIFAVLVAKIPMIGLIAVPLAATAISAIFGLLSLPAELAAIARYAGKTRETKSFPDRDQEDGVIRCAIAHAWDLTLPPVLRWIHK
jgi:hypothetical protein